MAAAGLEARRRAQKALPKSVRRIVLRLYSVCALTPTPLSSGSPCLILQDRDAPRKASKRQRLFPSSLPASLPPSLPRSLRELASLYFPSSASARHAASIFCFSFRSVLLLACGREDGREDARKGGKGKGFEWGIEASLAPKIPAPHMLYLCYSSLLPSPLPSLAHLCPARL